MKVLFWQWNAFMQKGIEKAFSKLNIEYEIFYYQPKDWEDDNEFSRLLSGAIDKSGADVVFSVNYAPVASNVCELRNVRYVSWIYDSPIHIRDISSFANSCNRIYCFDRGQCESYRAKGYENVYHMPLAADETVWTFSKNVKESEKYKCDVALVGQLYESDYNYLMGPLPQYYRGRMEGILCAQGELYGAYLLDSLLDSELILQLNEYYGKATDGKFTVQKEELEYACAREITGRERRMAMALLSSRYNVNLYSGDKCETLKKVNCCGYVDYYTQMPQAFAGAKINLNMSLKTIKTGIPLRVFDVLSCGGFLITNYQQELFEYFTPGEHLVVYENVKDLVQKVDYYLKNEQERERIAANGQKLIRSSFGFEDKIQKMFGGL